MDLAKALIIPHVERREKDLNGLHTTTKHKMALVLGRDLKVSKKREAPIQIDKFESFVDNEVIQKFVFRVCFPICALCFVWLLRTTS